MSSGKRAGSIALAGACASLAALATFALGTARSAPDPASTLPPTCSKTYGGGKLTVVSDLPLQGASRADANQMARAVAYVFRRAGFRAGKHTLRYVSCDDAAGPSGVSDPATCARNAAAYAREKGLVGIVGPLESPCAAVEIPVANRGLLPMVSPGAAAVGLTQKGATTAPGEPERYYPTKKRSFARVSPAWNVQGAADAQYAARTLAVRRVYVLDDGEAYGRALADSFEAAARKLGLSVLGRESWDPSLGATYEKQFQAIAARKPDLIFAGGLIGSNGGRLIQDKVTILGPNTGNVKMLAPDGFAQPSTIIDAGAGDADGLYVSAPTLAADSLRGAGRSFVEGFARSEHLSPGQLQPYAIYAAEAAEVMIDAIKRSDGTRAGVLQALLRTSIPNGILGQVRFDAHGDPLAPQITISRVVAGALRWMTQVAPPATLIRAAA